MNNWNKISTLKNKPHKPQFTTRQPLQPKSVHRMWHNSRKLLLVALFGTCTKFVHGSASGDTQQVTMGFQNPGKFSQNANLENVIVDYTNEPPPFQDITLKYTDDGPRASRRREHAIHSRDDVSCAQLENLLVSQKVQEAIQQQMAVALKKSLPKMRKVFDEGLEKAGKTMNTQQEERLQRYEEKIETLITIVQEAREFANEEARRAKEKTEALTRKIEQMEADNGAFRASVVAGDTNCDRVKNGCTAFISITGLGYIYRAIDGIPIPDLGFVDMTQYTTITLFFAGGFTLYVVMHELKGTDQLPWWGRNPKNLVGGIFRKIGTSLWGVCCRGGNASVQPAPPAPVQAGPNGNAANATPPPAQSPAVGSNQQQLTRQSSNHSLTLSLQSLQRTQNSVRNISQTKTIANIVRRRRRLKRLEQNTK